MTQSFCCDGCVQDHPRPGYLGPDCLKCRRQYPGQDIADRKKDYYQERPNNHENHDKGEPV